MNNLFSCLPTNFRDEHSESLLKSPTVRIERIVSLGHSSPAGFWYDQDESEWVVVLKGRAKLLLDGDDEPLEMGPGDFANIPAHKRHRVDWTAPDEPTIWLAFFFGEE